MPMTFTDEMVKRMCVDRQVFTQEQADSMTVAECREWLAANSEGRFMDYVEGWEIRTGRPWSTMTRDEAQCLIAKWPALSYNPGVLSRLMSR